MFQFFTYDTFETKGLKINHYSFISIHYPGITNRSFSDYRYYSQVLKTLPYGHFIKRSIEGQ
jgi:hypothetical protein